MKRNESRLLDRIMDISEAEEMYIYTTQS